MMSHYHRHSYKCLISIIKVVCTKIDCVCIFHHRCNIIIIFFIWRNSFFIYNLVQFITNHHPYQLYKLKLKLKLYSVSTPGSFREVPHTPEFDDASSMNFSYDLSLLHALTPHPRQHSDRHESYKLNVRHISYIKYNLS